MSIFRTLFTAALLFAAFVATADAEDGYDLWLRYRPIEASAQRTYRAQITEIVAPQTSSPTLDAAQRELARGFQGLLSRALPTTASVSRSGALVFGTPASSPTIAALNLDLRGVGAEGYVIRTVSIRSRRATAVAANSDIGALYGVFHLLRQIQTRALACRPRYRQRAAFRPAYARPLGQPRRHDRARLLRPLDLRLAHACPITVDPRLHRLRPRQRLDRHQRRGAQQRQRQRRQPDARDYLDKAAALADAFRPYGIRVYLSARFRAPMEIGGLPTADPLDPRVRAWWRAKADEIYSHHPRLRRLPGQGQLRGPARPAGLRPHATPTAPTCWPRRWRRTAASSCGAPSSTPQRIRDDRAKQAYHEFVPLDGKFRPTSSCR